MWGPIITLISGLLGESGPLGQWFKIKAETAKADEQYKLAYLTAQATQAAAQLQSDTSLTTARLAATTQQFKQYTFYFLVIPMLVSVCFPKYAAIMWHNFELIPEWFRTLFGAVYLTIWGIPVASGYLAGIFKGITQTASDALDSRMDRKVKKIEALNQKSFFDSIRKDLGGGVDQKTVDMLNRAIAKGLEDGQ